MLHRLIHFWKAVNRSFQIPLVTVIWEVLPGGGGPSGTGPPQSCDSPLTALPPSLQMFPLPVTNGKSRPTSLAGTQFGSSGRRTPLLPSFVFEGGDRCLEGGPGSPGPPLWGRAGGPGTKGGSVWGQCSGPPCGVGMRGLGQCFQAPGWTWDGATVSLREAGKPAVVMVLRSAMGLGEGVKWLAQSCCPD